MSFEQGQQHQKLTSAAVPLEHRAVCSLEESYRAFLGVVKSLDELNSCTFSTATATNQGHCLATFNLEIQAFQYLCM